MTSTDGHWPAWVIVPAISEAIPVIGCECGQVPRRRASRMSMQHTWHQAHRRGLKLCPVEYEWPDDAWDAARTTGQPQVGTGPLVRVRNAEWHDGGWVRTR